LIAVNKLKLRKANALDMDITYSWATNPKIRAYAFNQNEIRFTDHQNWFLNKINDATCYYFLLEESENPIGSIRFDIKNKEAIISYLIDPKYHGNGLGVYLLEKGIAAFLNFKENKGLELIGFVLDSNIASVKAFEKLNFDIKTLDKNIIEYSKKDFDENR
jgi:RimJ/RimL family protein N-acetyltransferase